MVNSGIITVDVHGKTVLQAKAAIMAAVRKCDGSVYRIRVIHGYNNGVRIKDMVGEEFGKEKRVKRIARGENPGITELVLREY